MNQPPIQIKRWAAWMPGVHSKAEWQAWAAGERSLSADDTPAVNDIPPMLRRRLSPLGKMALSVAWPLLGESQHLPSVFCSRHGELERTVGLLNNLANAEPLSPTHFSLSVHNAIGGVFSIARKDKCAISALAVGDEGLSQALLESWLILQESSHDELVCVIYDAPLPAPYPRNDHAPQHPYAAAFVLGKYAAADSIRLQLTMTAGGDCSDTGELHTLAFIRFLLHQHETALMLPGPRHQWCWQKPADINVA